MSVVSHKCFWPLPIYINIIDVSLVQGDRIFVVVVLMT